MVMIYDIRDFQNTTHLTKTENAAIAKDAEIILFTGVRYERLGDHCATANNPEQFSDTYRRHNACLADMGLTQKTV